MVREKKSKKENLMFMLLVILLVSIIMCVSSFGIATWARYRTATGGNVTAQIAKWSFKVNKQSEEFAQINLADTISFEHVEKTTIAPGTYGSFNLEIDGSGSEVSLNYYIDIDVLQKPTNMKFYLDSSHSADSELQIVNNKIQLENEILLTDDSMTKTEIIYWDWAYRTDKYPSQEVINKYLTEQPIDGLQTLVNEYNADGTTDSRKAEIALKINDLIDTKEAGKEIVLPIKVKGIQKYTDGLVSKGITITSDTTKDYDAGDEITFALEFTESIYADENKSKITAENAPVIMLDFEEIETANSPIARVASLMNSYIVVAGTTGKQAVFVNAERNKLNYKYELQKGDNGHLKILSVLGNIYNISGERVDLPSVGDVIINNNIEVITSLRLKPGAQVHYESSGKYTLNRSYAQSGTVVINNYPTNLKVPAETGNIVLDATSDAFKLTDWYVLNVDDDIVQLVPKVPSKEGITFQGANGYNNGVKILNDMCSALYSNSEKNIKAKSINIDDYENIIKQRMSEEELNEKKSKYKYGSYAYYGQKCSSITNSTNSKYPTLFEQETGSVINGKINESGIDINTSQSSFVTGYKTASSLSSYTYYYPYNKSWFDNTVYSDILFPKGAYWIAARYAILSDSFNPMDFGLRRFNGSFLDKANLYTSDNTTNYNYSSLFPVVTVNASQLQENSDKTAFEIK